jgi:hypothetical protein
MPRDLLFEGVDVDGLLNHCWGRSMMETEILDGALLGEG